MDGQTFEQIESAGLAKWLTGIRQELRSKTYQPQPVRRVMRPKPGGGERPLGIPTIRDRVVQTAAKIVLEPIFEADFEDSAYGYRPRRSAIDAVKEAHRLSSPRTDLRIDRLHPSRVSNRCHKALPLVAFCNLNHNQCAIR